jgi:sorting and assembly machinery component 37
MFVEHYWTFTRGALAKLMPLPQRLFVPGRLRKLYQPRLEAIGMWDAHFVEEPETSKPVTQTPEKPGVAPAQVYKHAFARQRVR